MKFLNGWKSYAAAAGLLGLGITQISQGDVLGGAQSILGALATFGVRSAIGRPSPAPQS